MHQITRLTESSQATIPQASHSFGNRTNYEYYKYGQLKEIRRGNGRDTQLVYDPISRLSRLNHRIQVYTDFTYNPASQIVTRAISNDAWVWTLDVNVNRNYAINTLNQYTSAGPTTFDYDAGGNLTRSGTDTFVHGAGVDDPLVWFEGSSTASSNRQYLLADERGSIVGVTDNAGHSSHAARSVP